MLQSIDAAEHARSVLTAITRIAASVILGMLPLVFFNNPDISDIKTPAGEHPKQIHPSSQPLLSNLATF